VRIGKVGLAREIKRPGVNLVVLWEEYRSGHPDGYGYSRYVAVSFLPAIVQAEGEAPRRSESDQALSSSVDALCACAGAHPKVPAAVKQRLREQYRTLDPVALLAEIRAVQEELGNRVDRRAADARGQQRASKSTAPQPVQLSAPDAVAFAKALGTTVEAGEPRATHRRPKRPYKTRVRMPSKLDLHVATIGDWLSAEPQLTALAIVGRLTEKHPDQFGMRQHSIVQRLLKALRKKAAEKLIAQELLGHPTNVAVSPGAVDGSGYRGPDPPTAPPVERASKAARLNRSDDVGTSAPTAPPG
jgi:hypothetical protein